MKLPLSWIKEIIDINLTPSQVAKLLTHSGLEVDSFTPLPLSFEKVIVGKVVETSKHPNAESLCVAKVSDGSSVFQVVCGAPNCRAGIKTAFAMEGAKLSNEKGKTLKIKKTKLRGIESFGMLCSEKELGLGEGEEGIMEFADHLKEGADISEIFGDVVLEISLTPNLGHCASVLGVARELSAATGKSVKLASINLLESKALANEQAFVEILDKEKCSRYSCRLIKNVKISSSPSWLQQRLAACDIRPVNNIVDITNYVLMEMGHPLHAFDYDLIEEGKILVRRAEENEVLCTLDGKERKLSSEDLLIADPKKPVAIAGVMGGLNSEVREETKNVLLESAYFQASSIRKTSKKLGLQTEASKRFERGCDYENLTRALDRAAQLMQEIAGGEVCQGRIDVESSPREEKVVDCRLSRINSLLGTQLSLSEVEAIFNKLEMTYSWDGRDNFSVTPPSYRGDINEEVDLVEEVARIYGFDNIPKKAASHITSPLSHSPIYLFENRVRDRLVAEGLQEFLTCDLIGPKVLSVIKEELMSENTQVKVLNPTSQEQSILRTSLLPGLLEAAKYNFDNENQDISCFEIGKIHFKSDVQYKEQSAVGLLLAGKRTPSHWDMKPLPYDFYDLKGIIENLLEALAVSSYTFSNSSLKFFHPKRQASIYAGSLKIGSLGEILPAIQRRLDVSERLLFAEIDLHQLFQAVRKKEKLKEIPVYPSSKRDLTMTLDQDLSVQEIFDVLQSIGSRLLESVTLSDVYISDKLGKGKKNVTLHFVYRDKKKTIAQEAVDAEHSRITQEIRHVLGGKI